MVDISFDLRAWELLEAAPRDPEAAAEILKYAADLLRNRKPLPNALADFIADAFYSAALKPEKHRVKALGHELHLTARNRRPKNISQHDIGREYEILKDSGISENSIKDKPSEIFNISESTVVRRLKEYKRQMDEYYNSETYKEQLEMSYRDQFGETESSWQFEDEEQ